MKIEKGMMEELFYIYSEIKERVEERLDEFKKLGNTGKDREFFLELIFCMLTPQSKARNADRTVRVISKDDFIWKATPEEIAPFLNLVRFKNKKAEYICLARERFFINGRFLLRNELKKYESPEEKRDFLVENVKGIGYKEASHFLRNTGFGFELAILDRHVVRNLCRLGILEDIDVNLFRKNYIEIEKKMRGFALDSKIPMPYLDFVFLYREIGDVFK